jgi:hypothetical protein
MSPLCPDPGLAGVSTPLLTPSIFLGVGLEIAGVPGFGLVYVPYRDLSETERLHDVELLRFAPF